MSDNETSELKSRALQWCKTNDGGRLCLLPKQADRDWMINAACPQCFQLHPAGKHVETGDTE